jgi:hypothetical protein
LLIVVIVVHPVYTGVVLTISRLPDSVENLNSWAKQTEQERQGYIEYTYLWHNLLGTSAMNSLFGSEVSPMLAPPRQFVDLA